MLNYFRKVIPETIEIVLGCGYLPTAYFTPSYSKHNTTVEVRK